MTLSQCIRIILNWSKALLFFFFFTKWLPTVIYTLSLHDALPISLAGNARVQLKDGAIKGINLAEVFRKAKSALDRKSTRLNSSHVKISYAVFCLKKKRSWKQDEKKKMPKLEINHKTVSKVTLTIS